MNNATRGAGRAGKKYVKTIMFSARANSLFVKVHPFAKIALLLIVSTAVVISMTKAKPDVLFNMIVVVLALAFMVESGTIKYLVKSYIAAIFIALFMLGIWWLAFNQIGGNAIATFNLFGAVIKITTESLYIAIGRVTGYAAMAFLTILTVMTTRDADIISALRKLKMPFKAVFFASLVSRNINIMAEDLSSIRQAQFVRGSSINSRNPIKRIREFIMLSVPLTATMIKRSVDVGNALEARGFSKASTFTGYLDERGFGAVDFSIIAFSIAMLALSITTNLTIIAF
ncbi:MAG: energy-coupling factor transporter transmembrane component T [Candidatus Micrarchaeaceae archaeon]